MVSAANSSAQILSVSHSLSLFRPNSYPTLLWPPPRNFYSTITLQNTAAITLQHCSWYSATYLVARSLLPVVTLGHLFSCLYIRPCLCFFPILGVLVHPFVLVHSCCTAIILLLHSYHTAVASAPCQLHACRYYKRL